MHDNYYACICFSIGSTVSQWLLLQVPIIIIVRQLKNYSIIGKFNSALLQQNTKTCASFSLNKSQLSSFWAPRLCTCMLDQRSKGRGTPIGAVSRAVTVVKMQSNGQGTSWGLVKWSSGVLDPSSSITRQPMQEAWPRFVHAQLVNCQWVKDKICRGQAVKAIFRRSKILTVVAALDTAPMGVTPP